MELQNLISLLAVGALLAGIGQGVKAMVKPAAGAPGFRGLFYVTMWAHPILAGALLGLPAWLPAPEALGDAALGRVVWYALAGVFSSSAYEAFHTVLKHRSGVKDRKSQRPPPRA